ncbi:unnamed protein product [Colias eurytheme]|nr:unnamed protein product [Colias eurytheme]
MARVRARRFRNAIRLKLDSGAAAALRLYEAWCSLLQETLKHYKASCTLFQEAIIKPKNAIKFITNAAKLKNQHIKSFDKI